LFFLVLLALWGLWFLRRDDFRHTLPYAVAASAAAVVLLMWPIAAEYLAVHKRYGLARGLGDIVTLSADVSSVVTASPLSLVWGWTSTLNGPERQLFPGFTILALTIVAAVLGARRQPRDRGIRRLNVVLICLGVCFSLIAASAVYFGPWRAPGISVSTPVKPFSLALVCWLAAGAVSTSIRDAYRRRSVFTFFVLAALTLFVFSLGPSPRFLGRQFFYQPPYAWLMRFSVFGESVRVPARFAMPAILAVSAAAALAFARLARARGTVSMAACIACAAIATDSWIRPVPVFAPPPAWPSAVSTEHFAAFVELPLGETLHDAAAMYRTTLTGRPTANGYSGYFPQHYEALTLALDELDDAALDFLSSAGPLLVAVDRTWPYARQRVEWLRAKARAREVAEDRDNAWFIVDTAPPTPPLHCGSATAPIVGLRDWWGRAPLAPVTDGDNDTFWASSGDSQQVGDFLELDLGRNVGVCSVRVSLGSHAGSYPRSLSVSISPDGANWQTSFSGRLAGAAIAAAVERPRAAVLELPLGDGAARFVRLQIDANHPKTAWLVTEVAVTLGAQ
jgi:hypothetical protein